MSMTNPATEQIARELTLLEALVDEFEAYIIDGKVYRTVLITTERGNRRVDMSGGDLLARVDALQTLRMNLTREQVTQLDGIVTQLESTKAALKTRLHELLQRELQSRLRTDAWFEEDRDVEEDEDAEQKEEETPAEQKNYLRIAAIRRELGTDIPQGNVDELDRLEEQLQNAVQEFQNQFAAR